MSGGKKILASPSSNWLAVMFPGKSAPDAKALAKMTDAKVDQLEEFGRSEGKRIWLIRRSDLLPRNRLLEAAHNETLPTLLPVYQSSGALVVPLKSLTVEVQDKRDLIKVLEVAKKHGLKVGRSQGNSVILELTKESDPVTVFDAIQLLLGQIPGLITCEPDLVQRREKF
jgi:hypothetical protein